jgi:hypothetical protein
MLPRLSVMLEGVVGPFPALHNKKTQGTILGMQWTAGNALKLTSGESTDQVHAVSRISSVMCTLFIDASQNSWLFTCRNRPALGLVPSKSVSGGMDLSARQGRHTEMFILGPKDDLDDKQHE